MKKSFEFKFDKNCRHWQDSKEFNRKILEFELELLKDRYGNSRSMDYITLAEAELNFGIEPTDKDLRTKLKTTDVIWNTMIGDLDPFSNNMLIKIPDVDVME